MGMPSSYMEPWTAEMVRAFPEDGKRYEVIDGELLVTPAPKWNHQSVVAELLLILRPWTRDQGVGETLTSPADIGLEPRGLVQPDVFVVPPLPTNRREWRNIHRLVLAIEVLSPSTAAQDRRQKRLLFLRAGVPEYWIADLERELIERWRPGDTLPELCNSTLAWQPDGAREPLLLDVPALFHAPDATR
jgi:Uma2 family endonuclease